MKSVLFAALVIAVVVTALNVVLARHESRRLFVEIQKLEKIRDGLNEEWGRLQLEQSTWATNGRIELMARNELRMILPDHNSVVLLTHE